MKKKCLLYKFDFFKDIYVTEIIFERKGFVTFKICKTKRKIYSNCLLTGESRLTFDQNTQIYIYIFLFCKVP